MIWMDVRTWVRQGVWPHVVSSCKLRSSMSRVGVSCINELLTSPGVHCDLVNVIDKLERIRVDGSTRLKIFSDFDYTLTCHEVNEKPGDTTHAVIELSPLLPSKYKEKAIALKDQYHPYEISTNISKDDRIKAMEEWWMRSHQLLLSCGFNHDMLGNMVKESNMMLRQGCEELFTLLHDANVPLVLFSAGIGDVIFETLNQRASYLPNMEIVSNRMKFCENGKLVGFNSPVIHTFNKGSVGLELMSHLEQKLQDRGNVILLGDSQGDPFMARDDPTNTVLRIGYLNHDINTLLPSYEELYDIVLEGETINTLSIPNQLIQYILQQ